MERSEAERSPPNGTAGRGESGGASPEAAVSVSMLQTQDAFSHDAEIT